MSIIRTNKITIATTNITYSNQCPSYTTDKKSKRIYFRNKNHLPRRLVTEEDKDQDLPNFPKQKSRTPRNKNNYLKIATYVAISSANQLKL